MVVGISGPDSNLYSNSYIEAKSIKQEKTTSSICARRNNYLSKKSSAKTQAKNNGEHEIAGEITNVHTDRRSLMGAFQRRLIPPIHVQITIHKFQEMLPSLPIPIHLSVEPMYVGRSIRIRGIRR
jgi:hypothetical protein